MNTKAGCWWLNTVTPVMLTEQQLKVRHHKSGRRKAFSSLNCVLRVWALLQAALKQHVFNLTPALTPHFWKTFSSLLDTQRVVTVNTAGVASHTK